MNELAIFFVNVFYNFHFFVSSSLCRRVFSSRILLRAAMPELPARWSVIFLIGFSLRSLLVKLRPQLRPSARSPSVVMNVATAASMAGSLSRYSLAFPQTSNSCSDYLVIHSTKYQDVTYPSTRLVKANTLGPSLVRLVEIAPRCLLVDAVHHHRIQCLMHRLHELWEKRSCSYQSIRPLIKLLARKGLLSVGNNDRSFDSQTAGRRLSLESDLLL